MAKNLTVQIRLCPYAFKIISEVTAWLARTNYSPEP